MSSLEDEQIYFSKEASASQETTFVCRDTDLCSKISVQASISYPDGENFSQTITSFPSNFSGERAIAGNAIIALRIASTD
ncbi:hypothetical protein [Candidatus Venteria ishoeyi]|uniref:hypothetical protein n=1 Tax=Candidatus Venteria ishoeyi TaxID=1899563 RepID=UPI0011B05001|nr:hypothetical protein [Candidatus Venteria ishoeyi]